LHATAYRSPDQATNCGALCCTEGATTDCSANGSNARRNERATSSAPHATNDSANDNTEPSTDCGSNARTL
jgi:hypothetical protein